MAVRVDALAALYEFWRVWWQETETFDDGDKYGLMPWTDHNRLSDQAEIIGSFYATHIKDVLDGS